MSGPCVIVGAGPAGMLAAIFAARGGQRVRLLDQNGFAGKKLNITGKGRCNVTNDCELQTFLQNVPRNGRFLFSAFSGFPPGEVMAFFEDLGVPLKVERGRRVFPASDRARDITDALLRELSALGVQIEKKYISGLWIENGILRGVRSRNERIEAGAVVLATGGKSYPLTGADGSGYALAEQAGHTVTETEASLVALTSPDALCAELQGVALKNVTLSLTAGGKISHREEIGEMLFTHFGLSGPMVLSASAHWKPEMDVLIDLKPGLTEEKLDARLLRDFEERINQNLDNALRGVLLKGLVPVILGLCGIDGETKVNAVTRLQRQALVHTMKNLPVAISGKGPIEEAIITRGGVETKEVNPKTMESKLLPGLYLAGELLDVDAYTGGFNLQIAFCTGKAAGQAIAESGDI